MLANRQGEQPARGLAMPPSPNDIQRYLRRADCYPSSIQTRLVNDLSNVIQRHPSLTVNIDTYLANPAAPQRLVYLGGTLPIVFRAATYNIPIRIWIMTYHPNGPPVIYVLPTPTMRLHPRHDHVDSRGQVYLPELTAWDAARSTIPAVLARMTAVFGRAPPLFAKRPPARVEPTEQERQEAVRSLVRRVRAYMARVEEEGRKEYEALEHEAERCRVAEETLVEAEQQVSVHVKKKVDELAAARARKEEVGRMIVENKVDDGDLSADNAITTDILTGQVVDCVARDQAFQDGLDRLADALRSREVDFDHFMLESKRMTRDLFYVRELKLTVRRKQAEETSAVDGMASLSISVAAGSASNV